jgi:ATP-dependent Lhr-like helicase
MVYARRATVPVSAGDLGALDPSAIDRVREEARPDPRDADELHDVLMTAGFITEEDARSIAAEYFNELVVGRRATTVRIAKPDRIPDPDSQITVRVAAERLPELVAVHPHGRIEPPIEAPVSRTARAWTRDEAIVELLRGRLALVGPTTARALAASLGITEADADAALLTLESEGVVLRGQFEKNNTETAEIAETAEDTWSREKKVSANSAVSAVSAASAVPVLQWCDRRLLARIHRYTLNRLRAEIEPVSAADFMRFLFVWQHAHPSARLTGPDGLRAIVGVLDGFELAASAWERSVLPARMDRYDPAMLDMLCLTGEVAWARLTPTSGADVVSTTPIALFLREHADTWAGLKACTTPDDADATTGVVQAVRPAVHLVLETLRTRGALFFHELATICNLDEPSLRTALADLVAAGLVTCDGFAGLRGLVEGPAKGGRHRATAAGRWTMITAARLKPSPHSDRTSPDDRSAKALAERPSRDDGAIETQARVLIGRYGVMCRRLLARETNAAPWRDLARVYRRLEARGEIRGGRFVTGMSGEQFALSDAVARLRETRRTAHDGRCLVISAADPLNLAGIVTTGDRVRAAAASRVVYRDGVPVAALEGEFIRPLADATASSSADITAALTSRRLPAIASGYVG